MKSIKKPLLGRLSKSGFLFSIVFALPAAAQSDGSIHSLGHSSEWKALLHYQNPKIGTESSEVGSAAFFLSKTGSTEPEQELIATIKAVQEPTPSEPTTDQKENKKHDQHAACRFPSRLRFILNHFPTLKIPPVNCHAYQAFRSRIATDRVGIVFSSYYLGSASSAFGHTLLKFSGKNENELFDSGINFSAYPTTQNPVLYALYGLIGIFPSGFSAQPFYYKIREYNDFESRDLWTYELNLNALQREKLLEHLWDLSDATFPYYYLSENCSYHIMRAIESANPEFHFFDSIPLYLIPSESIRMLTNIPGLVKNIEFRSSIRNIAFHRYEKLNSNQREQLVTLLNSSPVNGSRDPSQLNPVDTQTLDALIDAVDLNHAQKIVSKEPEITDWKQTILKNRSARPEVTHSRPKIEAPANEAPHLGHGSRRMVVSREFREGPSMFSSTHVQYRASHHDLLDPSVGFPRQLHIDFARIGFQWVEKQRRLLLDELTIVDLTALSPDHPIYSGISYSARFGFQRSYFPDCRDPAFCPSIGIQGGVGKNFSPTSWSDFVFLLNTAPQFSPVYDGSRIKFSVSPTVIGLAEISSTLKLKWTTTTNYTFLTQNRLGLSSSIDIRKVFANVFGLEIGALRALQGASSLNQLNLKVMAYW
jgi:hypothetical protein